MELRNKKILVTGGRGFLGRHLVSVLKKRGILSRHITVPDARELDLRVRQNCERAVQDVDIVFHLAGLTGGIEFHLQNPGRICFDNISMGANLMEAARRAGVEKFVTAGSAAEYPANARVPLKEEYLWLGSPAASHLAYAAAKKMLSVQARAYRAQYGFNAVHLLLTNLYGPGEPWDSDAVVASTIRRIYEAERQESPLLEVWGTGAPTRDFLYVEDAAAAFIAAAERYDSSEPVNIGSGREVSIRELVATLAALMGFEGKIVYNAAKPDGQPRRFMDCARAKREFGFRALADFKTSLKETIDWTLAHREEKNR